MRLLHILQGFHGHVIYTAYQLSSTTLSVVNGYGKTSAGTYVAQRAGGDGGSGAPRIGAHAFRDGVSGHGSRRRRTGEGRVWAWRAKT